MNRQIILVLTTLALGALICNSVWAGDAAENTKPPAGQKKEEPTEPAGQPKDEPVGKDDAQSGSRKDESSEPPASEGDTETYIQGKMAELNARLAELGENVQVAVVEYYAAEPAVGQIVYVNDRALQMGSHWAPLDPRRYGVRDIYWLSDQTEGIATGVSQADTQAAVANAMATWDGVTCATIPLIQWPDYGIDWGYVQYLEGFGGVPAWYADITHAGWLPVAFFDAIAPPDGGTYILGATFTFIWLDAPAPAGEPTDIDNNGKLDVAFREIYYNDGFSWAIDDDFDVETIVLHETGHGLSLGHFGMIFATTANGKLHFAPRAVMNAAYTGVQQELASTDNAAFCSIWGSWPNN